MWTRLFTTKNDKTRNKISWTLKKFNTKCSQKYKGAHFKNHSHIPTTPLLMDIRRHETYHLIQYNCMCLNVLVLPDLMSMGTTWVWVKFHSDKFDSNWVKRNQVPVLGSYSFYHLSLISHNLPQFKNGTNLLEPPRELVRKCGPKPLDLGRTSIIWNLVIRKLN